MTGSRRFAIQTGLFFLVLVLLFGGCSVSKRPRQSASPGPAEVKQTPAEQKKAGLLKTLERKFENPDAHFELGQLYQADGLWAKAEQEYKTVLGFEPVHRRAQAARVTVLMSSGDKALAEILADEYVSQASNSAAGSLRLALAFQKEGLDDYALACYRQALRLAPNSAKINRQIGYYYLSKNDKQTAREYLTRSFQLNPNQPEVAGQLGRLGVAVKIPRKTEKDVGKLDKMVEQSDKER